MTLLNFNTRLRRTSKGHKNGRNNPSTLANRDYADTRRNQVRESREVRTDDKQSNRHRCDQGNALQTQGAAVMAWLEHAIQLHNS